MAQEILIVGAGPTGLVLACQLYRYGVPCRIIDRATERHSQSRATDLQSRTLEVFQDLGLLEDVLHEGIPRRAINAYVDHHRVARFEMTGADVPFPFGIGLEQHKTEAILEHHLRRLGGRVERGVSVVDVSQRARQDRVQVTLNRQDGTWEQVEVAWLVGCDGALSKIRRSIQVPFEGFTYDERYYLADIRVDGPLPRDEAGTFQTADGCAALWLPIPGPGEGGGANWVRMFGPVEPDMIADGGDHNEGSASQRPTRASIERIVREVVSPEIAIEEFGWSAMYSIHSRIAPNFRHGRVFLAGDAAHVHSPVTGQGMNLGMQDAYNLGWKLALVARRSAADPLLDSYNDERHPVASASLAQSDRQNWMTFTASPWTRSLMLKLGRVLWRFDSFRRYILGVIMETGVSYRKQRSVSENRSSMWTAPIVASASTEVASLGQRREFASAPRAGDRAPDVALPHAPATTLFELIAGTSFAVLVFDGDADTAGGYAAIGSLARELRVRMGELVRVHVVIPRNEVPDLLDWDGSVLLDPDGTIHARYGAGAECVYIIRPDGYIGFRSQPVCRDAVLGYLTSALLVDAAGPTPIEPAGGPWTNAM